MSGLIVDYAGVFRSLERALVIYWAPGSSGGGTGKPVEDKAALVAALRQVLGETSGLCRHQGVDLAAIQATRGFARIGLLDDAVEALIATDEIKRRYLDLANAVQRLYKAVLPNPQSLNEEERRGLGEQLDERELALFDLLTKPRIDLSDADRDKVKATARELLATLKAGKLVLDWRKRQQARAEVRVTIEKMLDLGLPRAYTPELFEEKSSAIFQHVYDAYYGAGRSVYAKAA